MADIVFVALQCYECSTMQVKQKKKSSNKWICVICNQKQSVRKVFAQGYKAKEIRFFVQSFNMSRKAADEERQADADSFAGGEIDEKEAEDVRGKKRSDWSEYLHSESPNNRPRLILDEDGEKEVVKIVTEMPNEILKRPMLMNYSGVGTTSSAKEGVHRDDDNEIFKPSFSRTNIKTADFRADGVMKRKTYADQKNIEPNRVTKPTSKWDAYLIDDEGEDQGSSRFSERKEVLKNNSVGEWDSAIMDIKAYQVVDDEIHPDFI